MNLSSFSCWVRYLKPVTALCLSFILCYVVYGALQYISTHSVKPIISSPNNYTINYQYQLDASKKLTVNHIIDTEDKFLPISTFPVSFTQATNWVKYKVKNHSKHESPLVLHIDNPMLSELIIYEYSPKKVTRIESKKTLENLIFPHYTFSLLPNEEKTFLLKSQTLKHAYLPLVLYQKSDFSHLQSLSMIAFIAFISIVLVMVFYNLIIYITLKDKIYLLYVAYLFFALLVLGSIDGFGYYLFSQDIQTWINQHSMFFHYGLVLCLWLFTLYFLKYDECNNKRYKVSLYGALLYISIGFISFFYDPALQTKIYFYCLPLLYIWCCSLVIPRVKQDFSWARFYILSWFPLLVGAAVQPLVLLNIIEYSFVTRHAFLLTILVEILCMACALAERMRCYEQIRVNEVSYHPGNLIPRKVALDTTLRKLIMQKSLSTHVFIIKPENIDNICLYIDDKVQAQLFDNIYQALHKNLSQRHDVLYFENKLEKICLLENNRFALLISHQQQEKITSLVELIQQTIYQAYKIESFNITLSADIGIAKYPEHGKDIRALINHAQFACNQAEHRKNKWAFYLQSQPEQNYELISLAQDLHKALNNNELEIYHQPQMDLKTLRVCGSECLLRWKHKTQGFIIPTVFISVAENTGLITELTLWVIKKSLHQHAQIIKDEAFNHMVSINISGKDIESIGFYDKVKNIITESGISPDKIIFELTESVEIIDDINAVEVLEQLSSLGITISIDDFGTGYSSLAYINTLPFQELKIDRQFVEGVCDEPKRKVIAQTSVKMAKALGLEVVAEGINSKLDESTLRAFGCDIGQGYFYAKPMPLDEYIEWLNNQVNGQIPESTYGEYIPAGK